MNYSSITGIFFGISVMYLALSKNNSNLGFFLNFHGILIVCGGTAAAASISFPIHKVLLLTRVFFLRVLGKSDHSYTETILQLLEINKKSSLGPTPLNEFLPQIKNDFLKEAVSLITTGVLSEEEIRATLEKRLETIEANYLHEANMFRVIGRFPPAFGLLATTLGMIGLLQKMGAPDSQKIIGPAMSVGLIGTLYGIALANLIFIPIAENLSERTYEEVNLRRMIIEGIILVKSQAGPIILRERLNSYLLPRERVILSKKVA